MEQTIRERAYAKWEAAGCPPGDGVNFWLEAEEEIKTQAISVGGNGDDERQQSRVAAKRSVR